LSQRERVTTASRAESACVKNTLTCLALRQDHRLPSGSFLLRPLSLSTAFIHVFIEPLAAPYYGQTSSRFDTQTKVTKLTTLRTGTLLPAAAETPALANKLHPLGHVARGCYSSVHSGMCGLPARHSFRSPHGMMTWCGARFPPENAEGRGTHWSASLPTAQSSGVTVWHRLPKDSLASPPSPIRLGLS